MPVRSVQRVTLASQIADRLRAEILDGTQRPGQQLHEAELALAFGVSRGPLREAMQRLIQEGLLLSEPHRGVFVMEITEADVLDIFFVRERIEIAAIERVVSARTRSETSARLRGIATRMDQALKSGDLAAGGELDFEFHRTLVDAADSPRLSRTYTTVQAETRLCLHRLMDGYRSARDLAVEHLRLADKLATAPVAEIRRELRTHLGDPARILRTLAAADPTKNPAPIPSATPGPGR